MAAPSLVNVILGTWVSFSPWMLPFWPRIAASNTFAIGLLVIALALLSVAAPRYRAFAWLNALAGLWLFASPWVLGYADRPLPMWNSVICGGLIVLFATARGVVTVPAGYDEDDPAA